MNRRKLIKNFGKSGMLAALTFTTKASGHPNGRNFVFFSGDREGAERFLTNVVGRSKARRFGNDILFVDVNKERELFAKLKNIYGANTQSVNFPLLISVPPLREFQGEVEVWTKEWLLHTSLQNEDPITDGCYPISGGWWSVEGDWNPTANKVRKHLFESPNHTDGEFTNAWLESLTRPELQSVHSDHHREMINDGEVHWDHVNVECPNTDP